MNDQKIIEKGDYSLKQVYETLDRIFLQKGIEKKETARGIIEYLGRGRSSDFANFGKIMLGLKDQEWFINNVKEWIYCNSDDSENPDIYDEEDLLVYYGK